jgi:hypothetical protein
VLCVIVIERIFVLLFWVWIWNFCAFFYFLFFRERYGCDCVSVCVVSGDVRDDAEYMRLNGVSEILVRCMSKK